MQDCMETTRQALWAVPQPVAEKRTSECLVLDRHEGMQDACRRDTQIAR